MAEDGETKVSKRGRGRPAKVPNLFNIFKEHRYVPIERFLDQTPRPPILSILHMHLHI